MFICEAYLYNIKMVLIDAISIFSCINFGTYNASVHTFLLRPDVLPLHDDQPSLVVHDSHAPRGVAATPEDGRW